MNKESEKRKLKADLIAFKKLQETDPLIHTDDDKVNIFGVFFGAKYINLKSMLSERQLSILRYYIGVVVTGASKKILSEAIEGYEKLENLRIEMENENE